MSAEIEIKSYTPENQKLLKSKPWRSRNASFIAENSMIYKLNANILPGTIGVIDAIFL